MKRSPATAESLPETLGFLRDPRSYPQALDSVMVIETHFAWLFLAGSLAYKLKKPTRPASSTGRQRPHGPVPIPGAAA